MTMIGSYEDEYISRICNAIKSSPKCGERTFMSKLPLAIEFEVRFAEV